MKVSFVSSKRFTYALTGAVLAAALLLLGGAERAEAFCFSNESVSNASMHVRYVPASAFRSAAEKMRAMSNCNVLSGKAEKMCHELQENRRKRKEGALKAIYEFATGLPLVGDPVDRTGKFMRDTFMDYAKWQNKIIDDISAKFSTKFRKEVKPDGTQCCNWKNRDCNPSGKKSAKIYFKVSYPGRSRFIKIGATDHLQCRIDKRNPGRSGCRNYVFPAGPARPLRKTERGMLIQSLHGDKCLDVLGNNTKNGANVGLWKCHGGKNQRWTLYKDGIVKSALNGKCLDVAGAGKAARNGANVILWGCHGEFNQRWRYGGDATIVSKAQGPHDWCLEVKDGKTNNGANAHVWQCRGANRARWLVTKDPVVTRVLRVRHGGKCLDNTGKTSKGARVHSWACNKNNVNQHWLLKKRGGGYYEIKSGRSGLCLDVAGNSKSNGAKVHQWPCNGGKNQQWIFIAAGDGWFRIRARHSNKCLDLEGPRKDDGTPFRQWACQNASGQAFKLLD